MHRRDPSAPQEAVWRIAAIASTGILGLTAAWLVVFSTSEKQTQFGVLLGLWGGLAGAFVVFGPRGTSRDSKPGKGWPRDSTPGNAPLSQESQALDVRRFGELELAQEVAARREVDLNIELTLRREIDRFTTERLASLHAEISGLRAEIADKLGGQLRLERTETTRIIGADLEALQDGIERLSGSRESSFITVAASTRVDAVGAAPAADSASEILEAEIVEPQNPEVVRLEPARLGGLWSPDFTLAAETSVDLGFVSELAPKWEPHPERLTEPSAEVGVIGSPMPDVATATFEPDVATATFEPDVATATNEPEPINPLGDMPRLTPIDSGLCDPPAPGTRELPAFDPRPAALPDRPRADLIGQQLQASTGRRRAPVPESHPEPEAQPEPPPYEGRRRIDAGSLATPLEAVQDGLEPAADGLGVEQGREDAVEDGMQADLGGLHLALHRLEVLRNDLERSR
jgi:hypothetical protein